MILAAHAVRPMCPRCGRHVRGGVELQAAVIELRDALLAARGCAQASYVEAVELRVVGEEVAAISAELTGVHLRCASAGGWSEVVH